MAGKTPRERSGERKRKCKAGHMSYVQHTRMGARVAVCNGISELKPAWSSGDRREREMASTFPFKMPPLSRFPPVPTTTLLTIISLPKHLAKFKMLWTEECEHGASHFHNIRLSLII